MKVMLIAPAGAVQSALEQLSLDPKVDDVIAVSQVTPDADIDMVLVTPVLDALSTRAEKILGGSVIGRNALRLSPLDRGRRFAAATRRVPSFRSKVAAAELIVVLERDGILSGWKAARKWAPSSARAVYGIPPARAILGMARDDSSQG